MLVRKALLKDATNIYDLVNSLSGDGTLLKRSFAEICENVRDFTVSESDGGVVDGLPIALMIPFSTMMSAGPYGGLALP